MIKTLLTVVACLCSVFILTACIDKYINHEKKIALGKQSLERMYGEDDLSKFPLFQGGFLNFGYWNTDTDFNNLSANDRLASSQNLYHYLLKRLELNDEDIVLEIGSGLGLGCAMIVNNFCSKRIVGMDLSYEQIQRANRRFSNLLHKAPWFSFVQGAAEAMPFENASFSKIFSLEVAQHFIFPQHVVQESFRVLRPGGVLLIATFFATSQSTMGELRSRILTMRDNIDRIIPIQNIIRYLEKAGFQDIKVTKIGDHVWFGLDKWMLKVGLTDGWNRNWLKSYQDGLVDYYVISTRKPI